MSNTASNYNIWRLGIGACLAALATVAGFATASNAFVEAPPTGLWFLFITITYSAMVFASSYVEEEQHFWYWVASGWLGWLLIKR